VWQSDEGPGLPSASAARRSRRQLKRAGGAAGGKRLFADRTPRTALRLLDSTIVGPDGVVILTYQPAR